MSLSSLIRGKNESARFATATLATVATHKGGQGRTVASVATVAVATPPTWEPTREMNRGGDGRPEPGKAVPFVSVGELPEKLRVAAKRCCELHGDGPEDVAAMLADLTYCDPVTWDALNAHFEAQLSPAAPVPMTDPAVTCNECKHACATQHPAILACSAGVESGLAVGGFWNNDRHPCETYAARPALTRMEDNHEID